MITINKRTQDNALKTPSIQLINQVPSLNTTPKHRNIFTGKLRPRTFLSSGKGSRLEQKGISMLQQYHEENTAQKEVKPTHEEIEGVLHQFDNMQLEDFLKVVIVGKSKLSETKSKQIIRSLNGTWFKNTDANTPVSRLYCSLPIKKQRNASTSKIIEEQRMRKANFSEHFHKNYTPPNLFPKRKTSPTRNRSSPIKFDPAKISRVDIDQQIKSRLIDKLPSYREKPHDSKRKRRPSSYFSNNKHNSTFKFFQEENSCLVGKKMMIHD